MKNQTRFHNTQVTMRHLDSTARHLFIVKCNSSILELSLLVLQMTTYHIHLVFCLKIKLLIPCIVVDCSDPSKDAFNYYLSQQRICIEMAFWQLVAMFYILSGQIER
ncbi:hypothetical protein ACHAW6_008879 [Cyclotella cf. meneghiniana]